MTTPPLHPAALMVKDLKAGMEVTVVKYLLDTPFDIMKDVQNNTLTIVDPNTGDGIRGYDDHTPHTMVDKTFEQCGIAEGPDGWSAYICTIPAEEASELLRAHADSLKAAPLSRSLVGTTGTVLTASWAS